MLSQSGETEEIVRLLPSLAELGVPIVAITGQRRQHALAGRRRSRLSLARWKRPARWAWPEHEHDGDAGRRRCLALVVSRMRRFSREDFARFHPAGSLGYQLSQGRAARPAAGAMPRGQRRPNGARGAGRRGHARPANRRHDAGRPARRLSGIFTDSDLARLFEHRRDGELDRPIRT